LVLDTNVLLAAYLTRGVCHELYVHCERSHQIVTSDVLLTEFESKLLRKLKVPPAKASATVAQIRSHAEIVNPQPLDEPVCRDPDDDWVLATALAGNCECILTGDKDLLVLTTFAGMPILAPGAFWRYESERHRGSGPAS
jgi:putative PIN family toxin of toxin-antitoxin system